MQFESVNEISLFDLQLHSDFCNFIFLTFKRAIDFATRIELSAAVSLNFFQRQHPHSGPLYTEIEFNKVKPCNMIIIIF